MAHTATLLNENAVYPSASIMNEYSFSKEGFRKRGVTAPPATHRECRVPHRKRQVRTRLQPPTQACVGQKNNGQRSEWREKLRTHKQHARARTHARTHAHALTCTHEWLKCKLRTRTHIHVHNYTHSRAHDVCTMHATNQASDGKEHQ